MLPLRTRALACALLALPCGCKGKKAKPEAAPAPLFAPEPDAAPAARPAGAHPLFGTEIGLDHVGIAVKDLAAAQKTYGELLGFSKPVPGKLPNGIQNVNYYFEDATYLETLTFYDEQKAAWLATFLQKHTGGLFLVLAVTSIDDTASYLIKNGFKLTVPVAGSIQTAGGEAKPDESWRTLSFAASPLAGDPLFFIEYQRADRDAFLEKLQDKRVRHSIFKHDNTAVGLKAVWLAVPDVDVAVKAYESIGLAAGEPFQEPRLGAQGRTIKAGRGLLRLVAPLGKGGAVADFLARRGGAGVFGISIEVHSIVAAREWLSRSLGKPVESAQGPAGISVLLPPEQTHGVWLEFFQRPGRYAE